MEVGGSLLFEGVGGRGLEVVFGGEAALLEFGVG